MNFFIRLALCFALPVLTACASAAKPELKRVREGMDKDQVLNTAGNPARTFRTNSQDHWIYVFYRDNEEMSQILVFEDGKLIRIGKPTAKQNWNRELESIRKAEGFKTIDGGPEDVNQP